jgi:hypothetical protein
MPGDRLTNPSASRMPGGRGDRIGGAPRFPQPGERIGRPGPPPGDRLTAGSPEAPGILQRLVALLGSVAPQGAMAPTGAPGQLGMPDVQGLAASAPELPDASGLNPFTNPYTALTARTMVPPMAGLMDATRNIKQQAGPTMEALQAVLSKRGSPVQGLDASMVGSAATGPSGIASPVMGPKPGPPPPTAAPGGPPSLPTPGAPSDFAAAATAAAADQPQSMGEFAASAERGTPMGRSGARLMNPDAPPRVRGASDMPDLPIADLIGAKPGVKPSLFGAGTGLKSPDFGGSAPLGAFGAGAPPEDVPVDGDSELEALVAMLNGEQDPMGGFDPSLMAETPSQKRGFWGKVGGGLKRTGKALLPGI